LFDAAARSSALRHRPEQQEKFMTTDTRDALFFTVDFDAMRGKTPEQRLRHMIEAGGYDWPNAYITPRLFAVEGTGEKKFRSKLFAFGRFISPEAVAVEMKKENFTPGDHVHGLAFGATFPEEQRKHPIACLGSSAHLCGGRHAVCLDGSDAERYLFLYGWEDDWGDDWRFLGVQQVSDT
jgi:hypothetical protein